MQVNAIEICNHLLDMYFEFRKNHYDDDDKEKAVARAIIAVGAKEDSENDP